MLFFHTLALLITVFDAFAIVYVAAKSMGNSDSIALSAGLVGLIVMFVIEVLLYICRTRRIDNATRIKTG